MYTGITNITNLTQLTSNSPAAACVVSKAQERAVAYLTPNSHTLVGKTGIASLSDYSSLSSSLASLHSHSPVGSLNTANHNSFRIPHSVGDQSSTSRYSLWLKMRVCSSYLLPHTSLPSSKEVTVLASSRSPVQQSTSPNQPPTNSPSDTNGDTETPGYISCPLGKGFCPFAHPVENVRIEAGHVTVCYDYIKRKKCKFICCKYFHPPHYQIEEILKRGNEQRRLNSIQSQSASSLSNGGLPSASSTNSTCQQQTPSSSSTSGGTAVIHWQPATASAYNAYQLSGASATLGLYPPSGSQSVNPIAALPLPFNSAAAATTDPSLLLAAVLQQQRSAAVLMAAPGNSNGGAGGDGSGSTITPSTSGTLTSHAMVKQSSGPTATAAINGVSVPEFAQKLLALSHQQQSLPVYDGSQALRQSSHCSSPSFTSRSPAAASAVVVTAALAGPSTSTVVSETSTSVGAAAISSIFLGASVSGLCPGKKRRASDALTEAVEPSVDLHTWLSTKRAAHPGGDSVTEYGRVEGNGSCNGAGNYIAGVAEQLQQQSLQQLHQQSLQQQQRAEADLLSTMGDNPSSMAVASLTPAYSTYAYAPTAGYCPGSIPPQLAAAAAAATGVPNLYSSYNLFGLPYSTTPANSVVATGAYLPTATPAQYPYSSVYSAPQQAVVGHTGAADNQASIAALTLNNMLNQQSSTPVTVAGMQPIAGAPYYSSNPHQMANFAATLAALQQQQQQPSDLRQLAGTPVASATPGPQSAFQHSQQQQQQQAIFTALLRAHQSQVQQQQQLVAAQLVAAMQQATGATAYAPQSHGPYIMDPQFPSGMNGLAAAMTYPGVMQLANPITNVTYINDKGNLLEALPICRDFKAGKCHRNGECRYVHLLDESVEVHHGRVTVCRDAAKGRCTRVPCKYFHVPLFAISAHRSLALNSVLNNNSSSGGTLAVNPSNLTCSSTITNPTTAGVTNTNGATVAASAGPTTNSSSNTNQARAF